MVSKSVHGMLTLIMQETLTKAVYDGLCLHIIPSTMSQRSTLQSIVTLSTIVAEYMAMTEAIKEGIWHQGLLANLGIEQDQLKIKYDRMSDIYLTKNLYHVRTKHINVRFHYTREILKEGDLVLEKIFTRRRIRYTCLQMWFRELSSNIVRTYSTSFQLLEFGGDHLNELCVA